MQNHDKENFNSDSVEDDSSIDATSIYEKKLNLVMIPHIVLWKA